MQTVLSSYQAKKVSGKKKGKDTRANWVMFMFVSKCRYNVFRKRSTIQACEAGFRELEAYGYEFGAFGFAGNHLHFAANVPEKYSLTTAKTMLKTQSAKRVFKEKPNFRKLYPRGSFWSGYEHHQGFGADPAKAEAYIRNQSEHHNVQVVEDVI